MIGTVGLNAERLAALAAQLREVLQDVTEPRVVRAVVDASAELQRISDEVAQQKKRFAELIEQALVDNGCTCPKCTAKRATEEQPQGRPN